MAHKTVERPDFDHHPQQNIYLRKADPAPDVMGDYLAAGWTIDTDGRWHEPGPPEPPEE